MIPENLVMKGLKSELTRMLKETRKMKREWIAYDYNYKEVERIWQQ